MSRITNFNKEQVQLFFDNLETVMEKFKFTASKIYNMDETGISTVQDLGTIIAEKGKKRVGSVSSCERGRNVIVICAMNASGSFVPPVFIYPHQKISNLLSIGGPPESLYLRSKNG